MIAFPPCCCSEVSRRDHSHGETTLRTARSISLRKLALAESPFADRHAAVGLERGDQFEREPLVDVVADSS